MWVIKSLVQLEEQGLVQLGRGKVISKKDLAANAGKYPVYSSSKVGDGKFGEYGLYMFDEELITWSVDGGGRLFHREKHKFSITNVTGFLRILDTSVLSYKYLFHALCLLHSKINFDWVKKAHPSVLRKEYLHIPIPPLSEQKRIVAKLDAAFAEINRAIDVAESKYIAVEKLKAALLASALRGEDWPTVRLGSIIDVVMGQAPPGKACNKDGIGTPFVKAGEFGALSPVIKEWTTEPKKMGEKGDVFLCVVGATCGKINLGADCCIGRSVAALRPYEERLLQPYLYYFMSQQVTRLRSGSLGAAQTVISKDMINSMSLSLPPLPEQQRIVANLDAAFAEIDKAVESILQTKATYLALKSAILAQELQPPESKAA